MFLATQEGFITKLMYSLKIQVIIQSNTFINLLYEKWEKLIVDMKVGERLFKLFTLSLYIINSK